MLFEANEQGLTLGEGEPFTMVMKYGPSKPCLLQYTDCLRAMKPAAQLSRSDPKSQASTQATTSAGSPSLTAATTVRAVKSTTCTVRPAHQKSKA